MADKPVNPEHHVMFEAVPPVGLLSTMGPLLTADVTNPRELYSILSESRHPGGVMAAISVSAQPSSRLPPLHASSSTDVQFRGLGEQTQHSSYPDLVSLHRQRGNSQQDAVRKSTSLQDVSCLPPMDDVLVSKKLTPITRNQDSSTLGEQEKGDIPLPDNLMKDKPLPPIEVKSDDSDHKHHVASVVNMHEAGSGHKPQPEVKGDTPVHKAVVFANANIKTSNDLIRANHKHKPDLKSGAGASKATGSSSIKLKNGNDVLLHVNQKAQRRSLDCPTFIFPRGQAVEVRKPQTPKFDDYPEAYWELRSPTVQDPSDLKEDMIDRDYYRLHQISALHLRAMHRDVANTKMDYRKWHQHMQERLPPLPHPTKFDSTHTTHDHDGALMTDRSGKHHRLLQPFRNHSLNVATKPLNTATSPSAKKLTDKQNNMDTEAPDDTNQHVDDSEHPQEPQPDKGKVDTQKQEPMKPLKASVVNLCMEASPRNKPNTCVLDVAAGSKKPHIVKRPQSDKTRPHQSDLTHNQQAVQINQPGAHHNQLEVQQADTEDRELSAASNQGTVSTSLSHYIQRVPSAPAATPPPTLPHPADTKPDNKTDTNTLKRKNVGSKLILKKFNRLQVFGENGQANGLKADGSKHLWDEEAATVKKNKPYLPANRPPIYRLDTRQYPSRRHGSAHLAKTGDMGVDMEMGGYPILVSERGGMPIVSTASDKLDTSALNFRFRDGEVIVSRQGKKAYPV